MTTADNLNAALAAGKTVTVTVTRRAIRITPKVANAWAALGHPFFRMEGETLCMIGGQSKGQPRYLGIMAPVAAIRAA